MVSDRMGARRVFAAVAGWAIVGIVVDLLLGALVVTIGSFVCSAVRVTGSARQVVRADSSSAP